MASPKPSCGTPLFPRGGLQAAPDAWVVFNLGGIEFAVALSAVVRVVQAVEITALPDAPRGVRGVINIEGRIVPVFDLWSRFGQSSRKVRATDHLVIARTRWRMIALLVDSVSSVVGKDEVQITEAADILPDLHGVTGVMKREGKMVLAHDLEQFLSMEDHEALQMMLNL